MLSAISGVLERGRSLLSRRRVERELDEELRFHLERETERLTQLYAERGLTPRHAREAALRAFGGIEQCKENVRDERGTRGLEDLLRDLRFAFRNLTRRPQFAALAIVTLALGIGANTALFSLVHAVLLRPLPYAEDERLVHLRQWRPQIERGGEAMGFSALEIADYRERSQTLQAVAEYHGMTFTLLGRGEPQQVDAGVVSSDYFDLLGVKPLHGRAFAADDERPGAPAVLLLSHGFWLERFGGDPDVVGVALEMNDQVHTVVGVLPPVPQYPRENAIYLPTSACPMRSSEEFRADRTARMMTVLARLERTSSVEVAARDVAAVATAIAAEHPEAYPAAHGYRAAVVPLREELVRDARPTFLVLLGITALVLLIACANVACLTLAQLHHRGRELAVRASLGAGRARLVRQLLAESTLLASIAGALGVLLAYFAFDLLRAFASRFTPRAAEATLDWPVLGFAALVSLVAGLLAGVLPALLAHRDVAASSAESRVLAPTHRRGWQKTLLVSQLALAFVLLASAALLLRSFLLLLAVDPGYRHPSVLSLELSVPDEHFARPDGDRLFFEPLLERIAALPGVDSVARTQRAPLRNEGHVVGLRVEASRAQRESELDHVAPRIVSPGFVHTLGLPLLAGRELALRDDASRPRVALVNEVLASRHWPGESAIGRHVQVCGLSTGKCRPPLLIVGVVGNLRDDGLEAPAPQQLYVPASQEAYGGQTLLVRSSGVAPDALLRSLRALVHEADARTPLSNVRTLEQIVGDSLARRRLTATLAGLFALLALLVTLAGVVGAVAFSVGERTRELGLRVALGAERSGILALVLRQSLSPAVLGLGIGVLATLGAGRLLEGLLWGVGPHDPPTLFLVATGFLGAAAFASWLPARRAAAVDPVRALNGS